MLRLTAASFLAAVAAVAVVAAPLPVFAQPGGEGGAANAGATELPPEREAGEEEVDYRALVLATVDDIENLVRADLGLPLRGGGGLSGGPVAQVAALTALVESRREAVADAAAAVEAAQADLVPPERIAAIDRRYRQAVSDARHQRYHADRLDAQRVALAVNAYMGATAETLPEGVPVAAGTAPAHFSIMADISGGWLRAEAARARATAGRLDRAASRAEEDGRRVRAEATAAEARLAEAEADRAGAETALADAEAWLAEVVLVAFAPSGEAVSAVDVAQDRYQWALTLAGVAAPVVVNPGLTIRGTSRLSEEQLWRWFVARSFPRPEVRELVGLYLDEGAAAGVRGDVAFMQAALETGYFRFTGRHNYAGIGHCDSCSKGYDYADARTGVRAQVQLLRFYADSEAVSAELERPAAIPWLDGAYAQGCCVTWFGLTGVWATALHYGPSLLALYEGALRSSGLDPSG